MNVESLTAPSHKEKQEFIDRLNKITFGCIAYKLINPEEGDAWTLEQARQAIEKYRLFLILNYLYPDRIIVPSREIDKVWHCHILDTRKYFSDCDTLFGEYMEHFPYYGIRDESDRQALEDSFYETQELWEHHFETEM